MDDPSKANTPQGDPQERLQKSRDRAASAIESAATTVRNVAGERAGEVRDTVQSRVGEARSTLESTVSDAQGTAQARLADARDTAMERAEQARGMAKERAEEGVSTAAHGLKSTADRLRDVAHDLDEKDRWLGTALEKAATTAESAGDYMSGQNVNDIVKDAQNLARTNPAAFMGGAAALGFALARLGKATVERATTDSRGGYGGQGGVNRASTYASSDATRRMPPSIPTAPVKPTPAGYGTGTASPLAGARPATDPADGRTLNPTQSTPLHRSQT